MARRSLKIRTRFEVLERIRRWQRAAKNRRCSMKTLAGEMHLTVGVIRSALRNLGRRMQKCKEVDEVVERIPKSRSGSDLFRTLQPKTVGERTIQRIRAPYRRENYIQRRSNARAMRDLYAKGVGFKEAMDILPSPPRDTHRPRQKMKE
jgi:hypothetical protein